MNNLPALKLETPEPSIRTVNLPSEAAVKAAADVTRAEIPQSKRRMAAERLRFCIRVHGIITKQNLKTAAAVDLAAANAAAYPLLSKAGKGGSSALTIYNYRSWMKRLGQRRGRPDWENLEALVDRYGKDVRGAAGAAEFWKVFNALFLNANRLSISTAYRKAKNLCNKHGINGIPSERQVRYWLDTHADQAAVMAARFGESWAEDNIMSYIRRDWSSVRPNDCWVGDHHIFDAPVRVWDEDKKQWKAVRPWLTAWLDAKSLAFVGVHIGADSPCSTGILRALQNAIRLNGNTAPQTLYFDNGKDYLKKGFTEPFVTQDKDADGHKIIDELGAQRRTSLPYRGRAKTIERTFKEVCERFSKLWAGYLGNRPGARPEVSGFFWDNPDKLPSLQEFSGEFVKFLVEDYHAKPQDGIVLEGKAPNQVWRRGTGGMTLKDEDLWFAMLLPYTRNCPMVQRGAAVVIDKVAWQSDALWRFFKKRVMIKLDVVNGGNPVAFTLDGRMIAVLEPVDYAPALASDEEGRKAISEGMRRQRLELKRAFGIADAMSNGMWRLAPQEVLSLTPGEKPEIIAFNGGKSVKGGTHNYRLHTVKPAELADIPDTTARQEKAARIAEFDAAQPKAETKPKTDPAKLAEFHKKVIKPKRRTSHEHEEDW